MEILVVPDAAAPTRGVITWPGGRVDCVLGRGGVRPDKREGDGATPLGCFPLRRLYYRSDRLAEPQTGLPVSALRPVDGWCDDPAHPAYNRPVTLPFAAGHERMWREDHLYDLVLVPGHNDDPPRPGLGSAIFVHLAPPEGRPTAGCVALARDDLLGLLRDCDTGWRLRIVAA